MTTRLLCWLFLLNWMVLAVSAQDLFVEFTEDSITVCEGENVDIGSLLNISGTPVEPLLILTVEAQDAMEPLSSAVAGEDFSPSVIMFNYTDPPEMLLIAGDLILEGYEYFVLNISANASQITVGNRSSLLVEIKDNNTVIISMENKMVRGREGSDVYVCAIISGIPAFGGLGVDIIVPFELFPLDNITVEFEDFQALTPLHVTFTNATTNNDKECITFLLEDDEALEGRHRFEVRILEDNITLPENVKVGLNSTVVIIIDNDGRDTEISFSSFKPIIIEEAMSPEVCVNVTYEPADGRQTSILVYIKIKPLLDTKGPPGGDFEYGPSFELELQPNQTMACYTLGIAQDNFYEFVEIFYFEIADTRPKVYFPKIPPLDGLAEEIEEEIFHEMSFEGAVPFLKFIGSKEILLLLAILDAFDEVQLQASGQLSLEIQEDKQRRVATFIEACVNVTVIPSEGIAGPIFVLFHSEEKTAFEYEDFFHTHIEVTIDPYKATNGSMHCGKVKVDEVIIDDRIVEEDQKFFFELLYSFPPVKLSYKQDTINITIIDDDKAVVGFTEAIISVTEGSEMNTTICVSHKEPLQTSLSLNVIQLPPIDQILDSAEEIPIAYLTLGVNASYLDTVINDTACFNYSLEDDNIKESFEGITLLLEAQEKNKTCLGQATTLLVVHPNGDVEAGIVGGNRTVTERDGFVKVCVELNHTPLAPVEVTLSTMSGTAISGEDYEPIERNISFGSGLATVACVNIPIFNDENFESEFEEFTVSLTSDLECVFIQDFQNVTITISDDERPIVSFLNKNVTVEEGGTNTSICLEVHGLGQGMLRIPIVAMLNETGSGIVSSQDFNFSSLEVTFPNGSLSGTIECVELSAVNDNVLEDNMEVLSLTISSVSPDRVTFEPEDILFVAILDNDAPDAVIGFYPDVYYVSESQQSLNVCVVIFEEPAGGRVTPILVEVELEAKAFKEYKAASILDDVDLPDGRISVIEAGSNFTCYSVSIEEDDIFETTEMLQVSIIETSPQVLVEVNRSRADIFIRDSTGGVYLRIPEDNLTAIVSESSAQNVNLCVEVADLPLGSLGCDILATFEAIPDTAKLDEDIRLFTLDIVVPSTAEENSVFCNDFNLMDVIIDDETVEDDQNFIFRLLNVTLPQVMGILSPDYINVTIQDGDVGLVGFQFPKYEVQESSYVEICIVQDGSLQRMITVDVYMKRLSYPAVFLTTLTLGESASVSNTLSDQIACFNFTQNEDFMKESTEIISLLANSTDLQVTVGRDMALVVIPPNGNVTVSIFGPINRVVSEGSGFVEVCVELNHSPGSPVLVTLTTESVTAMENEDFASTSSNLTFAVGLRSLECINIPIINDEALEDKNEVFLVRLSSDQSCVLINDSQRTINVTILDDDDVLVGFSEGSIDVKEDDQAEICVEVCYGMLNRPIEVSISAHPLSAQSPNDFIFDNISITIFPDNFTEPHCFNVSIVEDQVLENEEVFELRLESDDSSIDFKISVLELNIIDNDVANLSLTQPSYTVQELSDSVEVCAVITSDEELETIVEAEIFSLPSTASEDDFSLRSPAILLFMANGEEQCINISVLTDSVLEEDEHFLVFLTSRDYRVNIILRYATVTIIDSTTIVIGFARSSYALIEDSDNSTEPNILTVCVTSTTNVSRDREISFFVIPVNGTAIGGIDYVDMLDWDTQRLQITVFASNQTTGFEKCFPISSIPDLLVERNETFMLTLESLDSNLVFSPDSTTVTLEDNDAVILLATLSPPSIEEGQGGEVCISVTPGLLERSLVVTVQTVDVNALALTSDYEVIDEDLTFSEDISSICLNYTTQDDVVTENDEVFTIQISSLDTAVSIATPELQVTIIDDDTANFSFILPNFICEESLFKICLISTSSNIIEAIIHVTFTFALASNPGIEIAVVESVNIPGLVPAKICSKTMIEGVDEGPCDDLIITPSSSFQRARLPPNATVQYFDSDVPSLNFINDTPEVTGNDVRVQVDAGTCFSLTCVFVSGCSNRITDIVDCTNETVVRDFAVNKAQTILHVTPQLMCGQRPSMLTTSFRKDSNHCDSHFINRGLTVYPNETVLVEFEPTGPSAEEPFSSSEFICAIDMGNFFSCQSPFMFSTRDLAPGKHIFTAKPPQVPLDICERRIELIESFIVP